MYVPAAVRVREAAAVAAPLHPDPVQTQAYEDASDPSLRSLPHCSVVTSSDAHPRVTVTICKMLGAQSELAETDATIRPSTHES